MNTLRINLHIRDDISPLLYTALIDLPGKPRAEYLRRLAEIGLHYSKHGTGSPKFTINGENTDASKEIDTSNNTEDHFGYDIVDLLGYQK